MHSLYSLHPLTAFFAVSLKRILPLDSSQQKLLNRLNLDFVRYTSY